MDKEKSPEIDAEISFEEIQDQIIEQIKLARFTIWIAVEWFSDRFLFELLKAKKTQGLNIQIVVFDDDINKNSGLKYEQEFEAYLIKPIGKYQKLIQCKFCVIDLKTVIYGCYNWTDKERWNGEIITVRQDKELAEKFASVFMDCKKIR